MFILASQSPRRQALLKRVVNDFEVQPAQIDEHETPLTTPGEYVQTLAQRKGEAIAVQYPTATILAADTTISFQGTLYGKPKDRQDAYEMLRQLSGQTHQVYTGLWLMKDGLVQQKVVQTDVTFWHLSTAEIEQYLDQSEYMDKAGAYGIQSAGALLIKQIKGDFYNVVGLPVSTVARMLQD